MKNHFAGRPPSGFYDEACREDYQTIIRNQHVFHGFAIVLMGSGPPENQQKTSRHPYFSSDFLGFCWALGASEDYHKTIGNHHSPPYLDGLAGL